jgi:hypothetical protein
MKKSFLHTKRVRIAADVILFFSVLFFPWWVSCILALLGVFFFENFFEAFFAGMLIDSLYGTQQVNIRGFYLFFSALFFGIFVFGEILKEKTRF